MSNKFWCFLGVHEYKILEQGPYSRSDGCGNTRQGIWYSLQCKCCGKVKYQVNVSK